VSGALERVIRSAGARRAEAAEHCDLCGIPVREQHRHLLDTASRSVMCACQACSLLFAQDAASGGHYKLVPLRRVRLADVATKVLGVPVGLAFFVPQTDGTVTAHYPSPAGATQWDVDAGAWRGVVERCGELRSLEPEVEALLVNTVRERRHSWIVPVDDCFRLVAVVRREWQGLSGGGRVWPQIDQFFDELTERR
jgi:hypothetical protein